MHQKARQDFAIAGKITDLKAGDQNPTNVNPNDARRRVRVLYRRA